MFVEIRRFASEMRANVCWGFVAFGVACRFPAATAVGWRIGMQRRKGVKDKSFAEKMLVLSKSAGVEDIEESFRDEIANYSVFFMSRDLVKMVGRRFLSDSLSDLDYPDDDSSVQFGKSEYRSFLCDVAVILRRFFRVRVIVQFNMTYVFERELSAACSESQITFVTAHKECLFSPGMINRTADFYKKSIGQYRGSLITVYNETFKNLFHKIGLAEKDDIYVVGCPRLDRSHRIRGQACHSSTPTLVYYLIENKAGMPRFFNEELDFWDRGIITPNGCVTDWSDMIAMVNRCIIELAADLPYTQFIFKGKTGYGAQQLESLRKMWGDKEFPHNIKFVEKGVGHDLLRGASVVVGFNSTAVLEAIAAGVPRVVPNFFNICEAGVNRYAHEVNDGVSVAASVAAFREKLAGFLEAPQRYRKLMTAEENVLDRLLGNPDGRSGQRLRRVLDKAMLDSARYYGNR